MRKKREQTIHIWLVDGQTDENKEIDSNQLQDIYKHLDKLKTTLSTQIRADT